MCEIKFRAWDKLGKFYTGNCIGFENHNNRLKLTPTASSRFTIEQYTGLKDKNGVEIYEGDIIYTPQEKYIKYWEVFFDLSYCGFVLYNGLNSTREIDKVQEEIEIVGNIHINHELLK